MKNILDKKIAIAGGGPGGLTLARLLQKKGATVTVYERDLHKDARPKGATLDLHEESGLAALKAAGLMDAFKANFRPGAEQMRILDQHATILFEDKPKTAEEIHRPEIDRGPLQKILLDSLQPGTVQWDSHLIALSPQPTGWQLEFNNGAIAQADLVIAADGANSRLRPYVTPIQPYYYGITVVEGAIHNAATASPKISQLLNGGKIFAFGGEKTLIISSKGDGSLQFYTGFKTAESWTRDPGIDFTDNNQVLDWFKRDFADWAPIYQELFENADIPFVARPQYCMPVDSTWEPLPNITLLGDAAHLMPAFAGEGVNMAMQDALELSECLTSDEFPTIKEAIAAYEAQMHTRASAMARESLIAAEEMHSPNAIPFISAIVN